MRAASAQVARGGRDAAGAPERILALTDPGGFVVKDDLTPGRAVDGDEFLLRDPRLVAAELLVTPASAAIVAVRRA